MRKVLIGICLIAVAFLIFSCGGSKKAESQGPASQETLVFKLSDSSGPATALHRAMRVIADEVKAKTDGRITIEVYPSGQLGDIKASMEAVQMGTLDMAITNRATCGAIVPEFAVLGAPFLFDDDAHCLRAIQGDLGKYLNQKMAEKNMTIVCHVLNGFRHVYASRVVKSIQDLRGLKIRTMENVIDMDTFNTLGAIATPMAFAELFTGLQQRTVDGAEAMISNILGERFYEVCPHVTFTGHFYDFVQVIISNAAMEKIPQELRATFYDACIEGGRKGGQLVLDENEKAVGELKAKGVQFYDIDRAELKKATEPVYTKNAKNLLPELIAMVEAARAK